MSTPLYPNAVSAIAVMDGKVLAISRGYDGFLKNNWNLPGGKVDSGETPEVAVLRELREETECEGRHPTKVFESICAPVATSTSGRTYFVITYRVELVAPPPIEYFKGNREGIVAWRDPVELLGPNCVFRDYNEAAFKAAGILPP